MMRSRRTMLKAGAAGTLAVTAPGIRRARAASNTKILTVVMQGDLRSLDPIWSPAYISAYYGAMVYDMLFGLDADLNPQPQMVGKWDLSEDKRTYTFALRDGLVWQDGTPVTAADCVASVRRWGARHPAGQTIMDYAKDLSAKDEKNFVLDLKEPFGWVISSLASPDTPPCLVMPKKVAETDPYQQITSHVGSGPFIFNEKDTRPGSRYVFDRFANYVPRREPASGIAGGKVVKLDRVIWESITDPQTGLAATEAGEIDFFELPPLDLLPQLQSNPDIKLQVLNKLGNIGDLRMNCLYPPFDNEKARQAMLYLVDQEAVLKAAFGNPQYYHKVYSIFGYNTPMTNDANIGWFKQAPDPAKAKQLFQEAGYRGEPVIVLQPSDFPFMNYAGQLIVSWLKQIGVNAQPAVSTWGGVVSRRAVTKPPSEGGWNIFTTYGANFADASAVTNSAAETNGKKGFFGWPENAQNEVLRKKWPLVSTDAERLAIAKQMQALLWDFVPVVLLGQWVSPAAMRKNVHGVIGMPEVIPFWNVFKT